MSSLINENDLDYTSSTYTTSDDDDDAETITTDSDFESNTSVITFRKSFSDCSSVFFKADSIENEPKEADKQKETTVKKDIKITEENVVKKITKSLLDIKMPALENSKQVRAVSTTQDLVKQNLRRIKSSLAPGLKALPRPLTVKKESTKIEPIVKRPPIVPKPMTEETKSKPLLTSKSKITVDTSKARSNKEVLKLCISELGWQECPNGLPHGCDIIWQSCASHEGRDQNSNSNFSSDSRLNKFPSMNNILKKGPLTHALNCMRVLYKTEYDFYPRTWFLPEQLKEFTQECRYIHDQDIRHNRTLTTFIVKPNDGSQGDGIYLINSPNGYLDPKTDNPKSYIVQEYVHNPYLIDGLKSDFRIYVVILSIKPLEIYICDEGLVRFATVDYQKPDEKNLDQVFMHLTNYSLNKKNETYQFSSSQEESSLAGHGSKRKLTKIFSYMSKIGINVNKIKGEIDDLIIKTVFALLPEIKVELGYEIYNSPNKQRPSSFQIIGFDILLKEDLKPILLEVNCNPSLRIDFESETSSGRTIILPSPIDVEIKKPLVLETLKLACPKKKLDQIEKLRREEEQAEKAAIYRSNLVNKRILERSQSSRKTRPFTLDKIPLLSKPSESYIRKKQAGTDSKVNMGRRESTESISSALNASFLNMSSHISSNSSSSMSNYSPSCLRNIYPNNNLRNQYDHLYIQENIADLFIYFTMYNGYKLMTHTEFRLFIKSCSIVNKNITTDNLDIIFYDLSKKWDMYNTKKRFYDEKENPVIGLCYQGFVECFTKLARMMFNETGLEQCVKSFVYFCKFMLLQKGFKSNQYCSLEINKIDVNVTVESKIESLKLKKKSQELENNTSLYTKTKKSIFPIFFDSTTV